MSPWCQPCSMHFSKHTSLHFKPRPVPHGNTPKRYIKNAPLMQICINPALMRSWVQDSSVYSFTASSKMCNILAPWRIYEVTDDHLDFGGLPDI